MGDRPAGGALPDHRGFPLVRDADGRDVPRACSCHGQRFMQNAGLACPDFGRIVLHPARLRKDLAEFPLRNAPNGSGAIENNGARTGRPLVEGDDVRHGIPPVAPNRRRGVKSSLVGYFSRS
jgi:hypothetical protein